jgi:lipopolysaccharide transport system permease protein
MPSTAGTLGRGSPMSEATITEETKVADAGAVRHVGPTAATRVYTPDSPLRDPGTFLRKVVRDAQAARFLAWRLFVRDVSAQYRQTAFGYLWAALPAVFNALVWVALQSAGVINVKTSGIPYIAFVLTGTMFWQLFVDSLNAPLKQLNLNRSMLNRVNVPTEAIFASGVGQVLFSFLIKLVVLTIVLAASGAPVKWTAPAIVLPAFALLLVGTVIGIFLATIGMLYRDIEQGLAVIVAPLMFLTPVIYSAASAGVLGKVIRVNPLTPMFEVTRDLLFGGVGPYLAELGIVSGVALVLGVAVWLVYRLSLPMLIERIEA